MNMKQFRYVLILASEKSVSRAADRLGISQPSLSQYLKKIESEIHTSLFDRSGNELRLTDAGKAYIDAGRNILDIERQMEERLSDISQNKEGSLSLGISPHRAVCLIPEVLYRFKKEYPGILVVVKEHTRKDLLDGLEQGQFDLCVMTEPVDEKLFLTEPIMNEEAILAVPSEIELSAEKIPGRRFPAVDLKVIHQADMITLSKPQLMQRLLDEQCREYEITYKKSVDCLTIETQLAMVRAGLGMALVPSGVHHDPDSRVRFYSIKQELPTRRIVAVYRKKQYLSAPVKHLLALLKQLD